MKIAISTITAICLLISGAAFAAKGVNVSLNGGTIAPKESLYISLKPLEPGVSYKISCIINASDTTFMHFNVSGAAFIYQNIVGMLNEKNLSGSLTVGTNGQVNKGDNSFTITSFTRNPVFSENADVSLEFHNLDDSAHQSVNSCYATPTL